VRLKEFACIPCWISAEGKLPGYISLGFLRPRTTLLHTKRGRGDHDQRCRQYSLPLGVSGPREEAIAAFDHYVVTLKASRLAFIERVGLTALRLGHGR